MISLRTVLYVRTVAKEGSFRKAAEKLYISQPSLSECILKAEKEYGVSFFNRKTSPVVLTYAGQVFLEEAEKIEHQDEELTRKLSDINSNASGRIVVGEAPSMSAEFIPELFRSFHQKFPAVQLSLREGSSRQLMEDIRHGRADMAFVSSDRKMPDLAFVPVVEREMLLEHVSENPSWKIESILLEEIGKNPFILLKEGREIRTLADDLFEKTGFRPNIAFETESYTLSLRMAEAGLGWSFVINKSNHIDPHMQYYRVKGIREMYHIRLAYRKDSYISRPMKYLMELAQQLDHHSVQ